MNILKSRRGIGIFIPILFFLLLFVSLSGNLKSDTWQFFQHDAGHTGNTTDAPELPLEIKWATQLCEWMNGGQSPIVANDSYAVVGSFRDWDTKFPQSTQGLKVWCINLGNGTVAWQKPVFGGVVGAPQIAGDKVYVVSWDARSSEADPYASTLWALRLSNGTVAWEKHFEGWWATPPCISGETLVVPVLYKPFLQGDTGKLYAYNKDTGTFLWDFPVKERFICGDFYRERPNPPCAYDGKVYFQDVRNVYAVNLIDGTQAWSISSSHELDFGELFPPLTLADGKVFFCEHNVNITEQGRIMCVDAGSGNDVWQWLKLGEEYSTSRINSLSYANGTVYATLSWTQLKDKIITLNGTTGAITGQSPLVQNYARPVIITGDNNIIHTQSDACIFNPAMDEILFDFKYEHGITLLGGYMEPAVVNSLVLTDIRESNDYFCATAFGHDTAPPLAEITKPEGALFNPGKITISGFANDFNFDHWELEYNSMDTPGDWTLLNSGTDRRKYEGPFISFWDPTTMGDGNWRIRLRVFDKAGLVSVDDQLTINQDHTPPSSTITYPTNGLNLETLSLEVTGTASDNMELSKVQVWDSLSKAWHDAEGKEAWSYEWSTTNSCTDVTFKSRAIDWAGNVETPKPGVTVTLSPRVKVVAVYPETHAEASQVMQGGELHRWVRVEDSLRNPVSKARIYYSTESGTKSVIADTEGVADLNIDSLDLLASSARITEAVLVNVPITEVRYSTCSFTPEEPFPTIPVLVEPREADHVWAGGLAQSLKAGITAYVEGQAGGGTEVSVANNKDLTINQSFDVGLGVGVEVGPKMGVGIAEAGASVGASVMLLLRGDQDFNMGDALCDDLDDADCKKRRKAYASLMIASIARTASVLSNPTFNAIIGALSAVGYSDYLEKESAHVGVSVSAGGSLSTSLGLSSDSSAGANIGLSLIDASVNIAYLIGINLYPKDNRIGIQAIQEIETQLSMMSFSVAGQGWFSASDYFGLDAANNSFVFSEEMVFDTSGNPREFILSISDGEEIVIYTVDDMEAIQDLLSTGASNITALGSSFAEDPGGLQLGLQACSQELTNLFQMLLEIPVHYERRAVYKIKDFDYTLSLDFNIQVITVGGGLSVNYEEKRVYAAEVGVFEGGERRIISSYGYDSYVRGDTHSLGDLMEAILDGLWIYVTDAIGWITQSVSSLGSWTIDTLGSIGGIRGTTLSKDAPTSDSWASLSGEAHSLSKKTDLAILSYTPLENPCEGLYITGKSHEFQPGDLVPLLPLELEIGYGYDPLPPNAEPSQLGLYHWNNQEEKWNAVSGAVMDTNEHTATASITELGLYAVGADITTPTITLLPTASDGFTTSGAEIRALVFDKVSGVDTVELEIDNVEVSSTYNEETELLKYTPVPLLSQGNHEIKIIATDNAGNTGIFIRMITVDDEAPTALITQPINSSELEDQVSVMGTASDANLDYYLVQMKPKNGSALWWIGLPKKQSVQNGVLAQFDSSGLQDGEYFMILKVRDKAGNEAVSQISVTLQNHYHGLLLH